MEGMGPRVPRMQPTRFFVAKAPPEVLEQSLVYGVWATAQDAEGGKGGGRRSAEGGEGKCTGDWRPLASGLIGGWWGGHRLWVADKERFKVGGFPLPDLSICNPRFLPYFLP